MGAFDGDVYRRFNSHRSLHCASNAHVAGSQQHKDHEMKYLVIGYTLLIAGMAHAQTTNRTFQDNMGRNVGRSSTDSRGNTTFYDNMGRNTGRASTQNGVTTFRDSMGRVTGRSK